MIRQELWVKLKEICQLNRERILSKGSKLLIHIRIIWIEEKDLVVLNPYSKQERNQIPNHQNTLLWIEKALQNSYKNQLLNMKIKSMVPTDHLFWLQNARIISAVESFPTSKNTNPTQLWAKQEIWMKNYRKSFSVLFQYMTWQTPTVETNATSKVTKSIPNSDLTSTEIIKYLNRRKPHSWISSWRIKQRFHRQISICVMSTGKISTTSLKNQRFMLSKDSLHSIRLLKMRRRHQGLVNMRQLSLMRRG